MNVHHQDLSIGGRFVHVWRVGPKVIFSIASKDLSDIQALFTQNVNLMEIGPASFNKSFRRSYQDLVFRMSRIFCSAFFSTRIIF